MEMSNAPESWFSRNGQWIWPLSMGIMLILVLLIMSSLGVDSDNHLGRCGDDGLGRWRGVVAV